MFQSMKNVNRGFAVPTFVVTFAILGVLAAGGAYQVRQALNADSSQLASAISLASAMKPVEGARFIFNAQRTGQCYGFCWMFDAPDRARKVEFELMHKALAESNPEAYLFLFGELEQYLEYRPLVNEFLPKVLAMKVTRENEGWLPTVQLKIVESPRLRQHLPSTTSSAS